MAELVPDRRPDAPTPAPGPAPPAGPFVARRDLRVSDAERRAVVDELRSHFGAGRLDLGEFEERTQAALSARVRGDLHPLLDDLPDLGEPAPSGPPVRPKPPRHGLLAHQDVRVHVYLWLVLAGFLLVIWAGTGFNGVWPIFPIAGTGLPLAVHVAIRAATDDSAGPPPPR
jgi:hypothetical protein